MKACLTISAKRFHNNATPSQIAMLFARNTHEDTIDCRLIVTLVPEFKFIHHRRHDLLVIVMRFNSPPPPVYHHLASADNTVNEMNAILIRFNYKS